MTSRERLLKLIAGDVPDCVPVAPDISNMVPCRLTGKPFWDMYLYRDPPYWEAYISAAKYFDIDSLMDGYFPFEYPFEKADGPEREEMIVGRTPERIVTQLSWIDGGKRRWEPKVNVYYVADPPTRGIPVEKLGMPPVPDRWQPVEGQQEVDRGPEGLKRVKDLMGDHGLVGIFVTSTLGLHSEQEILDYYDHPELHDRWAEERLRQAERRFAYLVSLEVRPDFICVGASGTLVFQSVDIFRQLTFPAVKRVIELAEAEGIPTHVHSCGPEKELVRIMAEETSLTIIDPLEIPPMGDCDLAELKRLYGDRIILKGNLHTTNVMLRGTPGDVAAAAGKAIDDAGAGGGFILSTGDQCGRDTPDENLRAMVETARTYGRY
ncbi:MAG: hypothetical protein JW909_01640 [Planctomycetes bacterium]|nr:hypothetical protein [Planctomycetota bacterium]